MPHLILEYSNNIRDELDLPKLLLDVHRAIVDTGIFKLKFFKSRVIKHDIFFIGDGSVDQAFVHLAIHTVSDRTGDDTRKAMITKAAMDVLREAFPKTFNEFECDLSVRITEVVPASYARLLTPGVNALP